MHLLKQVYMYCTLHLHRVTWLSLASVIGFYFVVSWLGLSFFKETVLTRPAEFFWYMQVTMSTVGYGDVTPVSPQAQSITLILNIIGQFYLAVVVALFVGKYLNKYTIF